MMLSDEHMARLARISKRAVLISTIGAVVVLAAISLGGLLLLQRSHELDQQIAAKQTIARRLNTEIADARAAKDEAIRDAKAEQAKAALALRQAKAERAESQDLRDQIKAAGDTNECRALAKVTDDHPDSSPPADPSSPRAKARAEWRASQAAILKKDTQAAEQHLQKAIAADPTYAAPYNSLGRLQADRGDFKDAERLYLEARKRSPTYAPALYNLAKITEHTRGREAARKYAEELVQLRPNSSAAQTLVRQFGGRTSPPATAPLGD